MSNSEWRGRFLDDFTVGDVYRSRLGRTISEADNTWFTCLTMNTNQMHFNREYAARTEFGEPLVVSTLTLAVVLGLSVADTSENAVANLGWGDIKLPSPVFAGDTLYPTLTISALLPQKTTGVVVMEATLHNQRAELVMTGEHKYLLRL